MPDAKVILGDCLEVLRGMEANSIDAVVTDPPAGIGFMGKMWDSFGSPRNGNGQAERDKYRLQDAHRPGMRIQGGARLGRQDRVGFVTFLSECLSECFRVAKPGSRLLCWAIPRTSHWTGTAIEDSGWVIEDRISHLFGQGFPKAKSKLKPACEDWWLALKPSKGVPALPGLDGCRIGTDDVRSVAVRRPGCQRYGGQNRRPHHDGKSTETIHGSSCGRWPANVVLSHLPECVCVGTKRVKPSRIPGGKNPRRKDTTGWRFQDHDRDGINHSDADGLETVESWECHPDCPVHLLASQPHATSSNAYRFYYTPKASRSDRGEGNTHPTVKSTDLMRWLCRLITPPGGVILDPFAGSGSTGKACILEGFGFLGIEQSPEYHAIAERRLAAARTEAGLFPEVI